jgi:hypothetical protein
VVFEKMRHDWLKSYQENSQYASTQVYQNKSRSDKTHQADNFASDDYGISNPYERPESFSEMD